MEKYIHAFNLVLGMEYQALKRIDGRFGNWQYAWDKAVYEDFIGAGLSRELAKRIILFQSRIDVVQEFISLQNSGVAAVGRKSVEYPFLLSQIADPPFLIYRRGAPLSCNFVGIAIVGTRMPSAYGEKIAYSVGEMITECGGVVVSGLAFGIDVISHRAALNLGRPTVAVLASGVNQVTPASHIGQAKAIVDAGGTIISEYPGETSTFNYRFLARNRLISGLCKATIVIEAKERSGALITARHALDQDRDVYALVGDILKPQAKGCLGLVGRDEAKPIVDLDLLAADLGFDLKGNQLKLLDDNAARVIGCLDKPLSIDELALMSGFAAHELMSVLSVLELKKLVIQNRFGKWVAFKK